MIGRTTLMEFRTGWKGFMIFTMLALLVAGGMPSIFPSFAEGFESEMEAIDNVLIEMPDVAGGNISLSWQHVPNATGYVVMEDNTTFLTSPNMVYTGLGNSTQVAHDFEEDRYYAVMATVNGSSDPVFLGMVATNSGGNAFDDFLENPVYAGFSGGRNVTITEITGFMTLEFYSWWWMLTGFFIAYIGVSMIASDFEGKRMDLIFSTPVSRERYLLEKFLTLTIFIVFITVLAGAAMSSAIASIGEAESMGTSTVYMSLLGSIPFFMVIAAMGMLTAVVFKRTRTGMGLTFMFLLFQFILNTLSGFGDKYENLKYISMMNYWDYSGVIFDGTFNWGHFIGLFVVAGMILGLAIYLFKKRDIPA